MRFTLIGANEEERALGVNLMESGFLNCRDADKERMERMGVEYMSTRSYVGRTPNKAEPSEDDMLFDEMVRQASDDGIYSEKDEKVFNGYKKGFMSGVDWEWYQMVDKAERWLRANCKTSEPMDEFIGKFKDAMEKGGF